MSQTDFYAEEFDVLRKAKPNHPALRVEPEFMEVGKAALRVLNSGGAWFAGAGGVVFVVRKLLKGESLEEGQHHVRMGETLLDYAERELTSHDKKVRESILRPMRTQLLDLVKAYETKGLQRTSDEIADAMLTLFQGKPLLPLQGTEDEWVDVSEMSKGSPEPIIMYQNKRCGTVFKDSTGKAWYLDGIICVNQNNPDDRYHTSSMIMPDGRTQPTRTFIKSFPFTPKTFEIKVRHVESPKDWWNTYCDMYGQLFAVREYYDLEKPYLDKSNVPK